MPIHSSRQTVFSISYIEGIILGIGEEVDEVAGGANGMGVDGMVEEVDEVAGGANGMGVDGMVA